MKKKKEIIDPICPHCGENLKEVGIIYSQTGTKFFDLVVGKGELEYQENDFQADDSGRYSCGDCDKELDFDYDNDDKVLEILK